MVFERDEYSFAQMIDFCSQMECGLEFGSNSLDATLALDNITIPLLIHNYNPIPSDPFVLNLTATDPMQLSNSIEMVAYNLAVSFRYGLPFYGLHAGFLAPVESHMLGVGITGRAQPLTKSYNYYCERFAAGLLEAVQKANIPIDYPILIENNVIGAENYKRGFAPHLMALDSESTGALIDICRSCNLNVSLLFDVGHANVSAHQLGYDRHSYHNEVQSYIFAYHLSENNGLEDTNNPIKSNSWFLKYLRESSNPIVTIEVASPVDTLERQIKILRESGC